MSAVRSPVFPRKDNCAKLHACEWRKNYEKTSIRVQVRAFSHNSQSQHIYTDFTRPLVDDFAVIARYSCCCCCCRFGWFSCRAICMTRISSWLLPRHNHFFPLYFVRSFFFSISFHSVQSWNKNGCCRCLAYALDSMMRLLQNYSIRINTRIAAGACCHCPPL